MRIPCASRYGESPHDFTKLPSGFRTKDEYRDSQSHWILLNGVSNQCGDYAAITHEEIRKLR
jgi:hypothetical protein